MPEAQVSTLNPGGSLNFAVGSLSGAVGIGNAGTGAICIAASDLGRPLAHPGSSAGGVCASASRLVQQSPAITTSERNCFMSCLLGFGSAILEQAPGPGNSQKGQARRP